MKFLKRYSILFIILFYISTNFLFNYPVFWGELFHDTSQYSAVIGEIAATEWGMEQIYERLINFENPFKPLSSIFYPFELDISTSDVGLGFHYLYLRPFFSPHQAMSVLVILNMFLANICMYILLRKLKINKVVSFLIGLAYGFMTFMTVRMGHLSYSLYYVFPLFYLSYLYFISAKTTKSKIIFSFITSFIFIFTMWQHMYYFIMLLISIASLGVYFLITDINKTLNFIKENLRYISLSLITIIILLIPWITAFRDALVFLEPPQASGWAGAIGFSSDLLGYFVPSVYNYYYGERISYLINKFDITFAKGIFENFTYPGLIILVGYAFIIIQKLRKKLNNKLWKNIKPFFVTSIVFWSLTLGPFLHVAGRWGLPLDEGIRVVIPLPYVILHYLPFLANIRTPGRLIVGFIFFAYIVIGFLLSKYFRNKSKIFIVLFSLFFILVFTLDQRYQKQPLTVPFYFPKNIYKEISKDSSNSSVLEIPFTVRDGFTYFGDEGSIYQIMGQFTYNKPLIGGYMGRIPDYIKEYYEGDSFLGYIGRLIDENVNLNGSIDRENLAKWKNINYEQAKKTIDFLRIKHIIFNTDKPYYSSLSGHLKELGYKEKLKDKKYILFRNDIGDYEFLDIKMGDDSSRVQLGQGWYLPEEGSFRWVDKKSSVMFKVNRPRKVKLIFTGASFIKENKARIYINKKYIKEIIFTPKIESYEIALPMKLNKGINTVYIIFDKVYKPSEVLGGEDQRNIAAKFYKVRIK